MANLEPIELLLQVRGGRIGMNLKPGLEIARLDVMSEPITRSPAALSIAVEVDCRLKAGVLRKAGDQAYQNKQTSEYVS